VRCGNRFTTLEEVIRDGLLVQKRDGRVEDFDRNKLVLCLRKVCEKRPVESEKLRRLLSEVATQVEQSPEVPVPTRFIAEQVMLRLMAMDEVAYIRFASRYKKFVPMG
jgi:transcriptional repressor NrdR